MAKASELSANRQHALPVKASANLGGAAQAMAQAIDRVIAHYTAVSEQWPFMDGDRRTRFLEHSPELARLVAFCERFI